MPIQAAGFAGQPERRINRDDIGISLGKMAIFVLTQIWQVRDEISIVMLIILSVLQSENGVSVKLAGIREVLVAGDLFAQHIVHHRGKLFKAA